MDFSRPMGDNGIFTLLIESHGAGEGMIRRFSAI
jgi:hypothetical protein